MARTAGARAGPDGSHPAPVPRRVMLISAVVGDGHDAAAAALREQIQSLWPGSEVVRLDALAAIGPRFGSLARHGYLAGLRAFPWVYQFFYAALWRHPWAAAGGKRLCGWLAGHRLARQIEAFGPDLIASTHPVGTAGLAWLCRRRGLAVPVGGWVPDFAPHPFWIYPDIDLNLLPHPAAIPLAAATSPAAPTVVAGPPVATRFRPTDRAAARRRAGLAQDRPVVLVACGSLGLGAVAEAVRALLSTRLRQYADGRGLGNPQLVVACGHNRKLAAKLARYGVPTESLRILGWQDDLALLLQAADLLITNDGCVTIWEALAIGTPVVAYRPGTAHGKANAALLAQSGLAEVCRDPEQLTAVVGSRLAQSHPIGPPPVDLLPGRGLWELAAAPVTRSQPAPMRSQDALFQHVQTPLVAQQIGTVMELGAGPGGRPLSRAALLDRLRHRLPAIAALRRVLSDHNGRPSWVLASDVDVSAHVAEQLVADPADSAAALDQFWTDPLPLDRPPWQMLLLTGLPDGRTSLAIKLHHCLGDGRSVIATLRRLLDDGPPGTEPQPSRGQPRPDPPPLRRRVRPALRAAAQLTRGLAQLAVAGSAPPTSWNRPLTTSQRKLVSTVLSAAQVSAAARRHHAHPCDVLGALVAEALWRSFPDPPPQVRAMLAVALPDRHGGHAPTQGNWTGAVALDLPLGPMPAGARVSAVRARLRRALATGQPVAAALVLAMLGRLPAKLHAAAARWVYHGRFMNLNVSYLPGLRQPQRLVGAPIEAAIPVSALTEGVPIAVAMMRWQDSYGVGVLLDGSLATLAEPFLAAFEAACSELATPDQPPDLAGPASSGRAGRAAQAAASAQPAKVTPAVAATPGQQPEGDRP